MANIMTKRGSIDNEITYEHICDTAADMASIDKQYKTLGSVCIVIQGKSGGLEVYIAGSNREWASITEIGGSNSEENTLGLYVCTNDEIDAESGLPDVSAPTPNTIYLVASREDTNNIYDEFVYVDEAWERVGGVTLDLSTYAPKASPEFTGSISLGRKANTTVGTGSVALGYNVTASSYQSYAEGVDTTASSDQSHAEGNNTTASGYQSHAEGNNTTASQSQAHAEGYSTAASGVQSHAEGASTTASGGQSHAEGTSSIASGTMSHAEGNLSVASGPQSHAEGQETIASGTMSHAEGYGGTYTQSGTQYTSQAAGMSDHVEGYQCLTASKQPGNHAEGYQTQATGGASHSEGANTVASGNSSHTEGSYSKATSPSSHAEGGNTTASGSYSHAEGYNTIASGEASHAEGWGGSDYGALGKADHAEGYQTKANSGSGSSNYGAHAEGYRTLATNRGAHAEGYDTIASSTYSHAEGYDTVASGSAAHAEGRGSQAINSYSHAQGYYTIASKNNQTVLGKCNVKDIFALYPEWEANKSYVVEDKVKRTSGTSVSGYKCKTANNDDSFTSSNWTQIYDGDFAEIVGNGSDDTSRSNARALTWEGDERLMGDVYVGCNADSTGGTKVAKVSDIPDTSALAPKASPEFTGSISLGRKANTTVGMESFAVGYDCEASNDQSHAEGYSTKASHQAAHAEGGYTKATQSYTHAEGNNCTASGTCAHAEGSGTYASERYAHSENYSTTANGRSTHASGVYNVSMTTYSNWTANTSYTIGDRCCNGLYYYECIEANSDSTFDSTKWTKLNYMSTIEAFVVGNGTDSNKKSNAYMLDWKGNGHFNGDVYTNCNADSTGGNKVATEAFVAANYASLAQLMNLNLPQYVEYTVRIDETNENPSSAVVYLDDAAAMSKGSSSWDTQPIFRDIKPCVFQNGEVNYYLDPNDFTKKADGTASVLDGTDGDVMIEFKKFAYRIYREGDFLYVSITNNPTKVALDPRYTYDAFSRLIEGDLDYFYEGAFKGYVDGNGKLRSIVGVQPTSNKNIGEFRTAAQANGSHYQQSTYAHLKAIQCLYLIKYGTLDSQTALGQGITGVTDDSSSNLAYVTGYDAAADDGVISGTMDSNTSTLTKGMCYGGTSTQHMRLFGLEDFWGNIWTWIDGLTTDASWNIITSWNSYSNEGITATSNTLSSGLSANGSGYIRKVAGTSAAGFMPILFGNGATSSKYWADYGGLCASCVLGFGGGWDSGAGAGAFRLAAGDSASGRGRAVGGRLSYA